MIRETFSIRQAAHIPGPRTTEMFSFKIFAEKAVCAQDFPIDIFMENVPRAFDTIVRGNSLRYLCDMLDTDELLLVNILITDVGLPIWFIFYLH